MNEDIPVQLEPLLRTTLEHRHRQRSSGCREPWTMEGLRVAKGCAVASLPTAARGSGFGSWEHWKWKGRSVAGEIAFGSRVTGRHLSLARAPAKTLGSNS